MSHELLPVTSKYHTVYMGFTIHPSPVRQSHFSLYCLYFPSSLTTAPHTLPPSQPLNWAQLNDVTHCHSFISSLHHSFCPSADLGIHLSIHLSAPFSLTSGNDYERQRGEERKKNVATCGGRGAGGILGKIAERDFWRQ